MKPRKQEPDATTLQIGKKLSGESPWDYYLKRSIEIAGNWTNPIILKTDASNEATNLPKKGGIAGNLNGKITIIEYDKNIISNAIKTNPKLNFIQGDIRKMPFKNDSYDLIIDTSTLDHIHPRQLGKTLEEYKRVLKPLGVLLLFCWCTDNGKYAIQYNNEKKWTPEDQYYFQHPELLSHFNQRFDLKEEDIFWRYSDIYMTCLIGEK